MQLLFHTKHTVILQANISIKWFSNSGNGFPDKLPEVFFVPQTNGMIFKTNEMIFKTVILLLSNITENSQTNMHIQPCSTRPS